MSTSISPISNAPMNQTAAIGRQLEAARNQVEKRFTEGGGVLMSVMEVLNTLLTSLGAVTASLESGRADETMAGLLSTVRALSDLPELEEQRLKNLTLLGSASSALKTHVTDMQETMRYLQTFAVTVKITGAGIAEFAGFAEEILDRIRSGTAEVNAFAGLLVAIEKELTIARTFSQETGKRYGVTVPAVVSALDKDAQTITAHRKALGAIAREVSAVAREVQNKVATTLSALQIGDTTRQRIEHVQSTLGMLGDFLETEDGRQLTGDQRERFSNAVHHLVAAQLGDMADNFQRESGNVVSTISSFTHDTQTILDLRSQMQSGDGNIMRALEESVSNAHAIVSQVEAASLQADQVSRSTLETATRLLSGIGNIRSVKTDIHYMALNTNLRCSRMGEEGRSINVITAELRVFAAKLDESADCIVNGLDGFEAAASAIGARNGEGAPGLGERLNGAIETIRDVANDMDTELANLAELGREVASKVSVSISKLDFQHDLGEVLSVCADDLAALAGEELPDMSDLTDALVMFGPRVMRLYTMAQERAIHSAILPASGYADAGVPAPVAATSDEDLFEDALF